MEETTERLAAPRERLVTLTHDVLPERYVDAHGLPKLTLGYEAIWWIEHNLLQPNGPRAGRPVSLVPSQALFLLFFYAVDEAGRWLFNRACRRLAKGSGKSPFAAMTALNELCGNCRVADFDDRVPGGVVGMPVSMPVVQVAATSLDQTANTMRMIRAMSNRRTPLAGKYGLEVGKTYIETPDGGKLQQITSSASAAEGAELTFAVVDETEHWLPGHGGPDLAETLDQNLGKTGGRLMETCNAWIPGVGSVAESTFDAWCKQQEWRAGKGRERAAGRQQILYDSRMAGPDVDLADDKALTGALRFVYDGLPWVKIEDIKQRIWSPAYPVSRSRRFYLNQPNAAEDAWVTLQEWSALGPGDSPADDFPHVEDGDEVVLFFDGSKSRDATALIGCRMSDGFVFTLGVWQPRPGEAVDTARVDLAVHAAFRRYRVVAFFADVREWESYTKTSWPDEFKDQLLVWAVPHGKQPQPIAWDMRSHAYEFAEATEMCLAEIQDGAFRQDGNWDLARHVGNCRRGEYKGRVYVHKESKDSPNKIDAAVCMIGARMVRRLVLASDAWESRNQEWTVW